MKPHFLYRNLFWLALAIALAASSAFAQLNWEGQTGAFVTPFAYTSPSNSKGLGHPQLAFHYLDGGSVVGNDFQISITEGLFKRVEFGIRGPRRPPGPTLRWRPCSTAASTFSTAR